MDKILNLFNLSGLIEMVNPVYFYATERNWLGVNVIQAVKDCDLIGLACLLIIALFSIISWAVIAYKWLHIFQANNQTNNFVESCMSGGGSLDQAFKATNDFPDSPLAQVLREVYLEMQIENWYQLDDQVSLENQLLLAKAGTERVIDRSSSNEIKHLESHLMILATTASVTPFIGLFGTVWGVQGAFQSLAGGAVDIGALAPGISTALATTVAGLIAAIPALVFYNYLTSKIDKIVVRMDSFSTEIMNIIQKRILVNSINK